MVVVVAAAVAAVVVSKTVKRKWCDGSLFLSFHTKDHEPLKSRSPANHQHCCCHCGRRHHLSHCSS